MGGVAEEECEGGEECGTQGAGEGWEGEEDAIVGRGLGSTDWLHRTSYWWWMCGISVGCGSLNVPV